MTAFEQYINISKKRQRYEENKEVINKLKSKLLDDFDITPAELIKKSIDKVKLEQEAILKELNVTDLKEILEKEKKALSKVEFKSMKKNRYTAMKDSFSKYEETMNRKEVEESKKKELEEAKMDARDIIIKTKKAIRKLENRIDKIDAEETKFLVKELEEALNGNDTIEIKDKINKLKEKDAELVEKFNGNQAEIDEEDIIDYEDEIIEVEEENNDDGKTEVLTSDMKPNRDDDKTDVLTSDMRPKTAEVIDFEAVRNELFKDACIEFDGIYKLYYNGRRDVYEFDIDEKILQNNIDAEGAYDFRIINKLKEFDEKYHTKLYERYMKNKLPVQYNFDEAKKNKVKKSSLKKLEEITERQAECGEFKTTTVKKTKKSKFGVIAATIGVAALTLIGAMGFGKKNVRPPLDPDKIVVDTVDDAGVSDAYEEAVEATETPMINESFYDIELVSEKVMEDVQKENENKVEEKVDNTETVEGTTDNVIETKIGDMITFEDTVSLYYASTDIDPNGNTSYLESDNYQIGLVSIVYEGEVVELIDSSEVSVKDTIEECKEKYGDDIKVFDNLDLVDDNGDTITKKVGWVEDVELGKVLTK